MEKKQESRRRILAAARDLFMEYGYEGVSVAAVMRAAGLTHGAFYAHFDSKAALHKAAFEDGEGFVEALRRAVLASSTPLETLIDGYLSEDHRRDRAHGCRLAAVGGEAALGGDHAKPVVERALPVLVEAIGRLGLDPETARALASTLVGGLILARAMDDPGLAADQLAAARVAARRVIGAAPPADRGEPTGP